ncbi:copper chaperone [Staphylococcus hominis]
MINGVIKVDGMSCDHCKNTIESALAKINGVRTAEVDLDKNEVRVDYNDELVSMKELHDTIEDQGYDVKK